MQRLTEIVVEAEWDSDAGVWVATSNDVPGLVTEHADFGVLQSQVNELIPLLLCENAELSRRLDTHEVPVFIAAHANARSRALVCA